jgi:hypothetical protein
MGGVKLKLQIYSVCGLWTLTCKYRILNGNIEQCVLGVYNLIWQIVCVC